MASFSPRRRSWDSKNKHMVAITLATKIGDCIDLKGWKKLLEKHYGKRCPEYSFNCLVCEVWRVYDIIESFVDFDNDLSKSCQQEFTSIKNTKKKLKRK